jgi:hypothetical protein
MVKNEFHQIDRGRRLLGTAESGIGRHVNAVVAAGSLFRRGLIIGQVFQN